ncbi:MAG TPA: methyltransferase domain-containing protein [Terracidiphilus sp.]|nr:methyltransferase domain-containing protein [Terracidiphilus sp.]
MKFRFVRGKLAPGARILDIGCGNNSPTTTKRWFPGCHYTGADIQLYNNSDADLAAMDEFFLLGADGSGYDAIPEASYDFVILNHVIEHMQEPEPIVAALCRKLKCGGYMWIAFPSERSLTLPHSVDETLNFYDDPTHVRVPDLSAIAKTLAANGVDVLDAGKSRESFFTTLADVFKLGKRLLVKALTGRFSGRGMWYILGFEDHVFGRRIAE